MQTRTTRVIALLLILLATSCSVFKGGGCDCPKFSNNTANNEALAVNR